MVATVIESNSGCNFETLKYHIDSITYMCGAPKLCIAASPRSRTSNHGGSERCPQPPTRLHNLSSVDGCTEFMFRQL